MLDIPFDCWKRYYREVLKPETVKSVESFLYNEKDSFFGSFNTEPNKEGEYRSYSAYRINGLEIADNLENSIWVVRGVDCPENLKPRKYSGSGVKANRKFILSFDKDGIVRDSREYKGFWDFKFKKDAEKISQQGRLNLSIYLKNHIDISSEGYLDYCAQHPNLKLKKIGEGRDYGGDRDQIRINTFAQGGDVALNCVERYHPPTSFTSTGYDNQWNIFKIIK